MIAVIDYGMGNLGSVAKALTALGGRFEVVDDPGKLGAYTSILLPGVGNFGDGMRNLSERGFVDVLRDRAGNGTPFFGICLGMQMLFDSSEEAPGVAGLSILPGTVRRFPDGAEKVPHMGWNDVHVAHPHPMIAGLPDGAFVYFVHSYYVVPAREEDAVLTCRYILSFTAAAGRGNVFATQFHPEKSQKAGLRLLGNFVEKDGI